MPDTARQVVVNDSVVVTIGRGAVEESTHRVHVVVAGPDGAATRTWGDASRMTLLRSVAKPFQAVPLVEDGVASRFGLTAAEISVCCASHNSEEVHLAAVRSILDKAGLSESQLVCGPHTPLLPGRSLELHAAGLADASITSNCSGKHAGMLALTTHHGWPTEGYERPDHPVQRRMVNEVSRWTGVEEGQILLETDGCGVPCFGIPLRALARGAARFASAAASGDEGPSSVVGAMTAHPFMVAGTRRLCTDLMAATGGRLFAKVGAEGVYLAGAEDGRFGLALKVEDGAWRAAPPALLAVLRHEGFLDRTAWDALEAYHSPQVRNTVGDSVGRIRAAV